MENATSCSKDAGCGNITLTNAGASTTQAEPLTLPAGVAFFAIVAGGILSVGQLIVFVKRRSLGNPFGVYLINLLAIDTILVFVHGPFNLIDRYGSSWYLGLQACIFWGHVSFTYQNLVIVAHFLIALNRVWAVLFPFSYRTHHSTKVAILHCVAPWLFLNIVNIPVALVTSYITPGTLNGRLKCNSDPLQLGI
ncbi:hypothetical protein RvY_14080 [Ramazzottius varieornatus]|uniref:G-protein coupled receptors family 1 profile domain-containing protein n=1 Tax=Ramazzottius varieornatus TaxID=947166 RepID=A0A1D1VQ65_RAMVA|nr:hypothetical protein RvY_14080 [Ramazzottius varieornatus]